VFTEHLVNPEYSPLVVMCPSRVREKALK